NLVAVKNRQVASNNPFSQRIETPDFPKGMSWINTRPLSKRDLKGKFVILDFWTYCCINCIHILPELKKLEKAYPNQLVVIGVHSAKFDAEKETKNIQEAVLRYEIEHPVVNDDRHVIWNTFGVRSWPSVLLIDPEGKAIWGTSGEITFEQVNQQLKRGIPYYRRQKLLDETPIRFELAKYRQKSGALRFPGKLLADEKTNRLFISDSNHNRIVITDLEGTLQDVIGSGAIGRKNGSFETASFDHPQGMALAGDTLYVADTENHMLRKVDLKRRQVTSLAGTGSQRRERRWPGSMTGVNRWQSKPSTTALNSPWALHVHAGYLYIAMAGPHQIWRMSLDEKRIGLFAGNGHEDIVDGLLLPQTQHGTGTPGKRISSFAQPSGLTSDGKWLFVADSEGSSIRAVPFDVKGKVWTVVGSADEPAGRLFDFGDVDGPKSKAKLQHALGVAYQDNKIYVTDTYNNKVKVVDAKSGETRTLAGQKEPGFDDAKGLFDEPSGITVVGNTLYVADTNNHAIRTIDVASGQVKTLKLTGVKPPESTESTAPRFPNAKQVQVAPLLLKPSDGKVRLKVQLKLPKNWKINELAPLAYYTAAKSNSGAIKRDGLGKQTVAKPSPQFEVLLPVAAEGRDTVTVSLNYYYCQTDGTGLCRMGSVVFTVPLEVNSQSGQAVGLLSQTIAP
ncbi:MAG: thioredoxin-like domain-containing protein, partial [Pirellulaceae bacterium]